MWAKRIHRMVEKNGSEVLGVLFRKYPSFVLSERTDECVGIPTFVFHDVTTESLEPMLRFLVDNRYVTLTADEYIERHILGQRGQEREVLLTFDDGRKSLYTVAYPALRRFDLKAVAYIVPGMTQEGNDSGQPEIQGGALCNWQEIEEMHRSGTLDIQSHSMYHHSIPISDRVVDFVRPNMTFSFLISDLAPLIREAGAVRQCHRLAYGTPIYAWGSRFAEAPAFQEDPAVVLACREYVQRHGGAEYFRTPRWHGRLKAVMIEARRKSGGAPGFESEASQRQAILEDLVDSRREIERRLPGKIVRHFCFPWFRGSALAAELSAEAGYISNAWGSLLPRHAREDGMPIPLARLSARYLWRLPGRGRRSLGAVFFRRVEARLFNGAHTKESC